MEIVNTQQNSFYVVGTDTSVGKTVLSLLLMQFFYQRNLDPFYIKPVQTGCRNPYDVDSDARFIYENVSLLKEKDPSDSVIYCFKNPKAPYFAARDEGKDIGLNVIKEFVVKKRLTHNPLIMEAAGGLLVPVNEKTLIIDMIKATGAQPIITAKAGLGTINHTLLSIEALKARGIKPLGIILMDTGEMPTPQEMIHENIEVIERVSGTKVAGVIGKIRNFRSPDRESYQPLERLFSGPGII